MKATNFSEFESLNGETIFMATTNGGHTAAIGAEATKLHPVFQKAAMGMGAVPAGMRAAALAQQELNGTAKNAQSQDRTDIIIEACDRIIKRADANPDEAPDLLLADGRPDVKALSKEAGITVTAGERDEAYNALKDEG